MNNRFNPVSRGPSTFQLFRFPIVFGSLLISFGVAFLYRDKILQGIVEEREKMYKEHPESKLLLQQSKEKMRRIHGPTD